MIWAMDDKSDIVMTDPIKRNDMGGFDIVAVVCMTLEDVVSGSVKPRVLEVGYVIVGNVTVGYVMVENVRVGYVIVGYVIVGQVKVEHDRGGCVMVGYVTVEYVMVETVTAGCEIGVRVIVGEVNGGIYVAVKEGRSETVIRDCGTMVVDSRAVLRFTFSKGIIDISEVSILPSDGDTKPPGLEIGTAPCSSFLVLTPNICLPLKSRVPSHALQTLFGKILHIEGTTGIICYCRTEVNYLDTNTGILKEETEKAGNTVIICRGTPAHLFIRLWWG